LIELQHVNVKLLVKAEEDASLEPLVRVFHGWIQGQVCDELLLDVTDYRHVYAGSGVVLIGHEGNYSLDNTDNRLGVRYNRKTPLEGSNQDRLKQAARAALTACQRLEDDPLLEGKIQFNGQDIEVFINDRLLTPNQETTREAVRPDLEAFSQQLFGGSEYSMSFQADPRRVFGVSLKTSQEFLVADLLANLAS
jgi:hypothetical protein